MFENFNCECPFCKEAAKWPKHNPYSEHNAHEEAVRAALHQAEMDNVIKDEIIEDLRKKLAKSEEKHKKATKMVKSLMKERNILNTSLRNRIEKVNDLLVKNAELKKMNASQRHIIEDSGYISMSEYDNAIKERNVYKSKCTTYEHLYDDVCKKYSELYDNFNVSVDKCVTAKLSNQEKPVYKDSKLHKDNLKTIYKLEEENKELKERLNKEKEGRKIKVSFDTIMGANAEDVLFIAKDRYDKLKKEKDELNDLYNMTYDRCDELLKSNKEFRRRIIFEQSNREYFQNKFYDKCKEFDGLEQKYWDAQRLIDKYAQSEEKTKEYLNAIINLYYDECVKTRKDCPLFGGFRGGKIFGDHGETGDSEML